jgi:hypothetical protein
MGTGEPQAAWARLSGAYGNGDLDEVRVGPGAGTALFTPDDRWPLLPQVRVAVRQPA